MDFEKQFESLKIEFDKAKNLRLKAEATLEQLEIQKKQVEEEIEELGIDPDNLEDEIKKLEIEIKELLEKVDQLMPRDLVKGDTNGNGR